MRVQLQKETEQIERDAKAARKAEGDKAEAARVARQESSSNALKMLKNIASKDKLAWLVHISALEDANDRALLTQSVIEATQMMEDAAEDRDDANAVIEAAAKKTSLSKEKQEEMLKALKIKKRAASAVVGGGGGGSATCARCGRNSHVTSDCAARTHLNGGQCTTEATQEAMAKYQRTRAGPGYAGPRESYAAAAATGPAFFPAANMQQTFQPAAATIPYGGGYGAPRGFCRRCGLE